MCHAGMRHGHKGMAGCGCGCGGHGPMFRRFLSNEEIQEHLESYRSQLEKELAGVEERIKDLKDKQEG